MCFVSIGAPLVGWGQSIPGIVNLDARADFSLNSSPQSVAIGDLDGDGKADLAVANYGSNTVSVYRNTSTSGSISSSSFLTRVDFATGGSPQSVAIRDLTGDGKAELVVANLGSSSVSVLRNTSTRGRLDTASFAAKRDFTTGTMPISLAIGDLDGDGTLDLAVANYHSATVSVLRSTCSGCVGFATKVDFTMGSGPLSLAIGDLDGDGKADLAIAGGGNTVSVLRNTSSSGSIGSGSFATRVDFSTRSSPRSVAIGDIDGDGKADLAVAMNNEASVSVFRNTSSSGSISSGSFATNVDFTTGTRPYNVAIGDLDGDGKADLAVANLGSNSISVLRNTSSSGSIGSGSFATKVDFTTGNSPYSVAIGDLDGDGKADLAIANSSEASISVLRNTSSSGSISSGSFATKVDFTVGTNPQSVAIGDLDGDGKADLVVANYYQNTISVYRNTSSTGSISSSSFATRVDFTTGIEPISVAIGDIDGDGKADLAVANHRGNTVTVFRNRSRSGTISGTDFFPSYDFSLGFGWGRNPSSVAIGDLNRDGKPELVVTSKFDDAVVVFQNTSSSGSIGSSSFASPWGYTTETSPNYVAIGDLNGDGWPELVVTAAYSGSVSVYQNNCGYYSTIRSGSFSTRVNFSTSGYPQSVAIGDLDGDGRADLAAPNTYSGANSVAVLRNTTFGSISFASNVNFTTGRDPYSVAIGDLDGDGKGDLVVTNAGSDSVSILRNTSSSGSIGSGSFASRLDFATGANPQSVAIGDLDGDGKVDLVIANTHSSSVSVYRNNPLYPIVGGGAVCVGSTRLLSNSTRGGIWSSSATSVATVNSTTGLVTGVAAGTAIITYAVAGGSDTALVTVNSTIPTVTTTPVSSTICSGTTTNITASGATTYTWAPSAGLSATTGATVTFHGTTTATYSVTGTSSGCSNTASQTITVTPSPRVLPRAESPFLCGTETTNITASGATTYTWSPSAGLTATTGATVTFNGTTTATYMVTGTSGSCSGVTYFTISVSTVVPTLAAISGASAVTVGSSTTYSNTTTGGVWSSSNRVVASVTASGVVRGNSSGTATISYSVTNGCGTTVVTRSISVNPATAAGVISGSTAVCIGSTITLSSTISGGTWRSSSSAIASITSAGVVRGNAAGTVVITYIIGALRSNYTLVVNTSSINAISGPTSVCPGVSTTLTNLTTGGTWSNVFPALGTINASTGVYTGISSGTDSVIYTVVNACGTRRVRRAQTVSSLPPAAGTISGASSVVVGATITLTSSVSGGTWSNVNTTISSVTTAGVVRGLSAGVDTIKYRRAYTCGATIATKVITVVASKQGESAIAEATTAIINVYPNPSTGLVTVEATANISKVYVYDLTGKLLDEVNSTTAKTAISLSNYASGTYLLRIITESGMGEVKVIRE